MDAPITEKADMWSLGAVMYCLLASSSNIMGWGFGTESPAREQMYNYWTVKLFTFCGTEAGGIESPVPIGGKGRQPHVLQKEAQPLVTAWFDAMRSYIDTYVGGECLVRACLFVTPDYAHYHAPMLSLPLSRPPSPLPVQPRAALRVLPPARLYTVDRSG